MTATFKDMAEALDWIRERMDARGISVSDACRAANVSRNSLYQVSARASALGPDSIQRLCESLEIDAESIASILRTWFAARTQSSALSGPFEVALEVIDALPAKRRHAIFARMVDAYSKHVNTGRSSK